MSTMNHAVRNAYLGNSVKTASPARLLVMLCDRLVLDVQRGREAIAAGNRDEARTQLLHAQDIVLELRASLDHTAWSGAGQLDALYAWMYSQLIKANTSQDLAVADHVLGLATEIADTWRQAALQQAAS
ncbi:flagellar export chaperone FliS [Nocardioides yefusunii]|uniref:Flagellar secretion chaperone FliS n=1 Tax=Nocardioides yefusunii TaxID=2500546 RepID=A0ABW1QX52_9ACTN|nr:flagellar export chaperone FliS [Nocardioides yefusunii]